MKWKYFISWIPGIPIAVINGSVRQYLYAPYMEELTANQLSVAGFILLFGTYVFYIIPWLKLSSIRNAFYLGFNWLLYTFIFEFIFGHFIMKHSWEKLLYEYNIFEGRLWSVVLLWIFIAPVVIFQYKNRKSTNRQNATIYKGDHHEE